MNTALADAADCFQCIIDLVERLDENYTEEDKHVLRLAKAGLMVLEPLLPSIVSDEELPSPPAGPLGDLGVIRPILNR